MTDEATGDLHGLATWWRNHRPTNQRTIEWIVDPSDPEAAEDAVNRAIDSGATLLALLSHGNDVAARAVISERAKVTPVQVRDQPADMDDLEWMSEVAAIRDLCAAGDPQSVDPAIGAVAAVLIAAKKRGTPVVFDGLIAHAGAMAAGDFDDSWLSASSSTDPAIQVAQEHWRVRPALDLHLRGDDDLGLRAVFALMDIVESR